MLQHNYDKYYDIDEKYKIIACNECGFYHIYPYPTEDYLWDYYSKDCKDPLIKVNLKEKVARIEGLKGKKEILDIGCGNGDLLLAFKESGFDVYGIDPCEESVKICKEKGLDIKREMLDKNHFGKKFDFINISYVLEHVSYPFEFMQRIKEEFLNSKGYIIIEIPNDFNPLQKIYSEYYKSNPYWFKMEHLNYWDISTFSSFIEKADFEIVYQTTDFPTELFLLMGEDYIKDKSLGKVTHQKLLNFEAKFKAVGKTEEFFKIYEKLSELNIGRSIHAILRVK